MEEKFDNNAMEKVENVAKEEKADNERACAEKRVELARLKQEEKQIKDKIDLRQKKFEENRKRQELKEQRFKAKQSLREEKLRHKNKMKEKHGGNGGWVAAVISLGICSLVLASVLTFTFLMPTQGEKALEAEYKRSFYDTTEQVDNMDLNMSKILASKDEGAISLYLTDLAVNSELAERDLQTLPLKDENRFHTTKLVNQIGDYAKYLNKKLINGENLTEEDRNTLEALYNANLKLKDALQNVVSEMGNDFNFSEMTKDEGTNVVLNNFNELENLSVEYPELIYDGPFSDGLDEKEIKGLSEDTVDETTAREIFISLFGEYGLEDTESVGTLDGSIKCFNFTATVKGLPLYAQISERGGKLILFSYAGSCNESLIGEEDAVKNASAFLEKNGVLNMKAVWINLNNNVYTLNFVTELSGAVVYPDMIKIRVCAETGTVIGYDANSYYLNHTERTVDIPTVSEIRAREKVSPDMEVDSVRLAIVPTGVKTERLCYEYSGIIGGATYYVYIDARTGRQVEMFKVVESTEGKLLM